MNVTEPLFESDTDTSTDNEPHLRAPEPSWRILDDADPLSRAAVLTNQHHLAIARMCVPDVQECVADVSSRLGVRLGVAEHRALSYVCIGFMLLNFPRLAANLGQGHLSFDHVRRLADSLECLPPEFHEVVESDLLQALSPRRPLQATPSVKRVGKLIRDIIYQHHPPARPKDPDEKVRQEDKGKPHQPELGWDERGAEVTDFFLTMNKGDSEEFIQMIKSVCRQEKCSRGAALMLLLRGQCTTEVTLNIYRPATVSESEAEPGRVWIAGDWLEQEASAEWMQRVTHVASPGWARCAGYQPTPTIRASVIGRDGHCRFPGCDVVAERCDLDHVNRWDHSQPLGGSAETSTSNLHCLCRKHHKLKTAGQWDVSLFPDGTEVWTSHWDGHTVVTEPGGVLGRETFERRASRRARVLAEHNRIRTEADDDEAAENIPF